MKICLFGGSFDPVHNGHLTIAQAAVEQVGVERILFLPAACSPFKTGQKNFYSDTERLRLLRAATEHLPWAEVSELDLTLPPPSWSWRLVETLRQESPEHEWYWLMGTDQWEQLEKWARYDYLVQHLHFIVYHRGTPPTLRPGVNASFIAGEHPASASAIRQALAEHLPIPADWIPTGIGTYPNKQTDNH